MLMEVMVLLVCTTSARTAAVGSLISFDERSRNFKLEFCNNALHIAFPPSSPILFRIITFNTKNFFIHFMCIAQRRQQINIHKVAYSSAISIAHLEIMSILTSRLFWGDQKGRDTVPPPPSSPVNWLANCF